MFYPNFTFLCSFLTFSYPYTYKMEKVLFLSQTFEMKILMYSCVLRSYESENHIFSKWSVCVCLISITLKQITAETSNLVFNICITYRCYLKRFIKIGQKFCLQGHTKEF